MKSKEDHIHQIMDFKTEQFIPYVYMTTLTHGLSVKLFINLSFL
jgi:hypothetical protein